MIEVTDIKDLVKVINEIDRPVVILSGTLGSGKTTFVQAYVRSLGLVDEVTSPTFSIQNIYADRVYHYDLYNKGSEEFLRLGMLEELEKEGVHFLEWGEGLEESLNLYGFSYMKIEITTLEENKRLFKCIR